MNLCLLESTNRHWDHIERKRSVNSSLLWKLAIFATVHKKVVGESLRTVSAGGGRTDRNLDFALIHAAESSGTAGDWGAVLIRLSLLPPASCFASRDSGLSSWLQLLSISEIAVEKWKQKATGLPID
jgi:hypothetical protein